MKNQDFSMKFKNIIKWCFEDRIALKEVLDKPRLKLRRSYSKSVLEVFPPNLNKESVNPCIDILDIAQKS